MNSQITTLTNTHHALNIYSCTESDIWIEDSGMVHTYGIELRILCANKSMKTAQQVLLYPDISIDRDQVNCLTELMNDLQLAPIHVRDVIEDYLVDYSIE